MGARFAFCGVFRGLFPAGGDARQVGRRRGPGRRPGAYNGPAGKSGVDNADFDAGAVDVVGGFSPYDSVMRLSPPTVICRRRRPLRVELEAAFRRGLPYIFNRYAFGNDKINVLPLRQARQHRHRHRSFELKLSGNFGVCSCPVGFQKSAQGIAFAGICQIDDYIDIIRRSFIHAPVNLFRRLANRQFAQSVPSDDIVQQTRHFRVQSPSVAGNKSGMSRCRPQQRRRNTGADGKNHRAAVGHSRDGSAVGA